MKFTFWGTRGSIPTPSNPQTPTDEYGGDTTCVSVSWGQDGLLIIDAGTGIRRAGFQWLRAGRKNYTILFTHAHWDHLQGFPFFAPAYMEGITIEVLSPRLPGSPSGNIIQKALHAQQEAPYFPAGFPELKAKFFFREVQAGEEMKFASGKDVLRVQSALTRHPGGCFAYRLDGPGTGGERSLVFATDNEPPIDAASPLLKMTRGADLLICDGQYTDEEHEKRRGWGHGTPSLCLQEAAIAKAKRLLVTHFDPGHADSHLEQMEDELIAAGQKQGIQAAFARQNQEIEL
jgi:phosphoribosyl 1,2-cyclic phosphodiesterase